MSRMEYTTGSTNVPRLIERNRGREMGILKRLFFDTGEGYSSPTEKRSARMKPRLRDDGSPNIKPPPIIYDVPPPVAPSPKLEGRNLMGARVKGAGFVSMFLGVLMLVIALMADPEGGAISTSFERKYDVHMNTPQAMSVLSIAQLVLSGIVILVGKGLTRQKRRFDFVSIGSGTILGIFLYILSIFLILHPRL